jgi:hypothetical protein
MNKIFLEKYEAWAKGDQRDCPNDPDAIASLNEWLRSLDDDGIDYHLYVDGGYQFPCEIRVSDGWNHIFSIAFNVKAGEINVFPTGDFIMPNFISLKGYYGELIHTLNDVVKKNFGLV